MKYFFRVALIAVHPYDPFNIKYPVFTSEGQEDAGRLTLKG